MSRIHLKKSFFYFFLALLAVGLVFIPTQAQAAEGDWWEPAVEDSQDQIKAVQDTVDQTMERIEQAGEALDTFEEWANSNLSGSELESALNSVTQARGALDGSSRPLQIFSDRLGQGVDGIDKVLQMRELANSIQSQQGGKLGSAMRAIGLVMQNYGSDVPIIGDVVQFYGEATLGMLDAINEIDATIEQNRNQGMFGAGTMGNEDNPLFNAMVEQFGEDFAVSHTYAPGNIPYVYSPIEQGADFALIWDADTQTWNRVDQSASAVASMYRNYLLANGRPSPAVLTALLTTGFEPAHNRHDAANELQELWQDWSVTNGTFSLVDVANSGDIRLALRDPELFAAKFAHDQDFNRQVQAWIVAMLEEAGKDIGSFGPDTETIRALQAWAEKYGIPIPVELADAAEPEEPTTPTTDSDTTGAAVSPTVTGPSVSGASESVVILFDASGSMGDNGKIDAAKSAARNVLAQVTPSTEVALIVFYGCGDIQIEHPFTTDFTAMQETIKQIQPSNDTPLADSILFAKRYIRDNASTGSARLVILSDGEETCGGDPVAAAQQ